MIGSLLLWIFFPRFRRLWNERFLWLAAQCVPSSLPMGLEGRAPSFSSAPESETSRPRKVPLQMWPVWFLRTSQHQVGALPTGTSWISPGGWNKASRIKTQLEDKPVGTCVKILNEQQFKFRPSRSIWGFKPKETVHIHHSAIKVKMWEYPKCSTREWWVHCGRWSQWNNSQIIKNDNMIVVKSMWEEMFATLC